MLQLTDGACVGLPAEWWIKIDGGLNNKRARNICRTACSIRDKCKQQTLAEIANRKPPYGQIRHGRLYDDRTGRAVPECACGNMIFPDTGPIATRCTMCARLKNNADNLANAKKRRDQDRAAAAAMTQELIDSATGQVVAA